MVMHADLSAASAWTGERLRFAHAGVINFVREANEHCINRAVHDVELLCISGEN